MCRSWTCSTKRRGDSRSRSRRCWRTSSSPRARSPAARRSCATCAARRIGWTSPRPARRARRRHSSTRRRSTSAPRPECARAPWLDALLEEAGARATCLDLTDVLGRGSDAHLRPLRSAAGPLLVPLDRALIELVWSATGYPSRGAYRDSHRLTGHRHCAWAVDGAAYDPRRASAQARADARDFVEHAAARVRGGAFAVFAVDTELVGLHWHEPVPAPELPVTSWGTPRDLSTWSAPPAGGLAWRQRAAELRAVGTMPAVPDRALRELLALQSSDWAFLAARSAGRANRKRWLRDRGPVPVRARRRARVRVRGRAGGAGRARVGAAQPRAASAARRARRALSG